MDSTGWLKLYRSVLTDGKIRTLSPGQKWAWICYLLLAQPKGEWRGYLTDDEGHPFTVREKADAAGMAFSYISRLDKLFVSLGLVEADDEGRLKVRNWDKYQPGKSADSCALSAQTDESLVHNRVHSVHKSVHNPVHSVHKPSPINKDEKKEEEKKESARPLASDDYDEPGQQDSWAEPTVLFMRTAGGGWTFRTARMYLERHARAHHRSAQDVFMRITELHGLGMMAGRKPWELWEDNNGNGHRGGAAATPRAKGRVAGGSGSGGHPGRPAHRHGDGQAVPEAHPISDAELLDLQRRAGVGVQPADA